MERGRRNQNPTVPRIVEINKYQRSSVQTNLGWSVVCRQLTKKGRFAKPNTVRASHRIATKHISRAIAALPPVVRQQQQDET